MPHDIALVDECSADLTEYARTDPLMRRELDRARAMFFGAAGEQPYVQDQQREDMAQARLLDWFLFDYQIGDGGPTPIEAYQRLKQHGLNDEKRRVLEDFGKSIYGVFEVTASQPGQGITLRDLADEKKYVVQERRASTMLSPEALVLGRVIPSDDQHVLSAALSIWREDARATILSAYERTRANAESMYVSPVDMEKLFWEAPRLAAPPEPRAEEAEHDVPGLEESIHIRAADRAVRFRIAVSDNASLDDCIRTVAAATQNPLEVLEQVRARHPIRTPDEFRQTMEHIHRVCAEYEQAPPVQHFDVDVNLPLGAGPEERSLTRQFGGIARSEITVDRYATLKLASDELRVMHRRWLDTRQEALDHLTPREVIQRERSRAKGRRVRPYRQAQ